MTASDGEAEGGAEMPWTPIECPLCEHKSIRANGGCSECGTDLRHLIAAWESEREQKSRILEKVESELDDTRIRWGTDVESLESELTRLREELGEAVKCKPLGETEKTGRGFRFIAFQDRNGVECTLQQSSVADYTEPWISAIWLGCDKADPKVLVPGEGWKPYPMPENYNANTRMHLGREQVGALVIHLLNWLNTGDFNDATRPASTAELASDTPTEKGQP